MASRHIADIDMGMRQFRRVIDGAARRSFTKVGLPSEATVGAPKKKGSGGKSFTNILDLAEMAAVHEFGAPNRHIPERSFIRTTYDENLRKIEQIAGYEFDKILNGKSTLRVSLARMGEWLTAKMKNKIRNGITPANAPATIKAKGSSVPLIDTAQLIQSITHVEVVK